MSGANLCIVTIVAMILMIAQFAKAQTTSTQPPSQTSNGELVARSPQPRQLNRRRQQRLHQQRQQPPPQQQAERVVTNRRLPQQPEEPEGPAAEQDHSQQHRHRSRSVRQSNPVPASVMSYSTALQRFHRERHPRVWWAEHFAVIVLDGGGYYYFDSGYWYPCWGYDPNYEAYDYDGPIFTYGNLLPDQVILNVQRALTNLGYYGGALSGSLSPATRYAISAYQQDNGLAINGIVDAPLVYSLGLD
jgi:Putative peptidoglycan binding domain